MDFELIAKQASGVMIAVYIPQHVHNTLAIEGGEKPEDFHVTMVYLPGIGQDEEKMAKIVKALEPIAADFMPLKGRIGGIGMFNASESSDGKDVYYASYNSPGLSALRQAVLDALDATGLEVSYRHGFTPHITLKYADEGSEVALSKLKTEDFEIPALSIASRSDRKDLAFTGRRVLKADPSSSSVHVNTPLGSEEEKVNKGAFKKLACDDEIMKVAIGYPDEGIPMYAESFFSEFFRKLFSVFKEDPSPDEVVAATIIKELCEPDLEPEVEKILQKVLKEDRYVPILKADKYKQIVYGVVLAPDEMDAQEDWMTAEDIEKTAHDYLIKSRVVGSGHKKPIDAGVVESYIAPQDFDLSGQYGSQKVKKGSWVMGVKVSDKDHWNKVVSGDIQGFSVGGFGLRDRGATI